MASKKILVNIETLQILKKLKAIHDKPTYDALINDLINNSERGELREKISNSDLQFSIASTHKKSLTRIEALHTRIGYFEKDYFFKIQEIYDYILNKNKNKEIPSNENIIHNSELSPAKDRSKNEINIYRNKIELLQKSHQELEASNEKLNKLLGILKNKTLKKTGVFASGYELNLSDEEYKNIFE